MAADDDHTLEHRDHGKVITFFLSVRDELRRVSWPNREQVAKLTGVVIAFVVVMGIFLGGLDWMAGSLVNWFIDL